MQSGGRDPSVPAHVVESLEQDFKNLQGLKNSLDAQRLVALAKRFHEARRIVILAADLAAHLAGYLEYQISLLGLPIFAATSAGRILHLVRSVNKQDLVIAISFRRGLRQTVEGAEQARANGAYCVGIADTYLSPLARECNEIFWRPSNRRLSGLRMLRRSHCSIPCSRPWDNITAHKRWRL